MTESQTGRIQTGAPETYKRLMIACGLFAGIALGVGSAIQRPFVGVGLYTVGMLGTVAIPAMTEYTLFDERDDAIHRQASGATIALFGWISALLFPSLVVLSSTSYFSWGPASGTLSLTTVVVYTVYGLALGYYSYR